MQRSRIWITGIGAATPLGCDFAMFRRRLMAGESATRRIDHMDASGCVASPGSVVDHIPVPATWDTSEFRTLPRLVQMAHWTCAAALVDAGLDRDSERLRVGIVLGCGAEWLRHWETDWAAGGSRVEREPSSSDSLADALRDHWDFSGPASTIAAACASGNYALAQARRWLQLGIVDVCLAGGVEIATPVGRAGFANLRALSKRVDDAARASRPFDQDRDGFVMGEGAALFVLERADDARRRTAEPYAEIAGFGATSDASHMIIPSSDPEPAAAAMRLALADAGAEPGDVSYINAHATSTPVGDRAEARALQLVLGPHVAITPVSSTKSMTGHLLSAAAAVEALACIAAIAEQAAPPTINLDAPDPECGPLCHVAHHAINHSIELVLSNSFGFGGSNTTLALRKAA